jgi:hypothetical protein
VRDQIVDRPQLQRVAIELIEEDRVEEHAGDLRRRWIPVIIGRSASSRVRV